MDEQQLRQLKPELDRFVDQYASLFGRDENQVADRMKLDDQNAFRLAARRGHSLSRNSAVTASASFFFPAL